MISILENIADIGVALPPFLMTLAKWVKTGSRKTGKTRNDMITVDLSGDTSARITDIWQWDFGQTLIITGLM